MSDQNLITDSEDSKKLLALQDLVRTEKDLVEIAKKSSVFNPFDVLKVSHAEIRHSNVLAWLFNPQGNHGFGDWFSGEKTGEIIPLLNSTVAKLLLLLFGLTLIVNLYAFISPFSAVTVIDPE
mgnify:CR=1 FL=1